MSYLQLLIHQVNFRGLSSIVLDSDLQIWSIVAMNLLWIWIPIRNILFRCFSDHLCIVSILITSFFTRLTAINWGNFGYFKTKLTSWQSLLYFITSFSFLFIEISLFGQTSFFFSILIEYEWIMRLIVISGFLICIVYLVFR